MDERKLSRRGYRVMRGGRGEGRGVGWLEAARDEHTKGGMTNGERERESGGRRG